MCKLPLTKIQESISALFDSISSEKFLIELLKEHNQDYYTLKETLETKSKKEQAWEISVKNRLIWLEDDKFIF